MKIDVLVVRFKGTLSTRKRFSLDDVSINIVVANRVFSGVEWVIVFEPIENFYPSRRAEDKIGLRVIDIAD